MLVNDREIRVLNHAGQTLGDYTIDPKRNYQTRRKTQPMSGMSCYRQPRCPATSHPVELLHAYLNTAPELDQALKSLSTLIREPGEDQSVASPPRKVRTRPPRSIISKIVVDYEAGSSSLELAAMYDIPKSSLLVILKKEGVVRSAERVTDEQVAAASQLIQSGKSVAMAATELDIAVRSLYHHLKLRGMPTRAS